MAARKLVTSAGQELPVHLVPAQVEHNGPAAVQTYFRPQETGNMVDDLVLLHVNLRGRHLAGVKLPLPPGYSGVVLERQRAEDADQGTEAGWAATASFSHLHYYQHDAAPLKGDGLRRCLDWSELAAQLHRPVDSAAVAGETEGKQDRMPATG